MTRFSGHVVNAVPDLDRVGSLLSTYIDQFNEAGVARTKLYPSKPLDAAAHSMRIKEPALTDRGHADWLAKLVGHMVGVQKDIEVFANKIESVYKALDHDIPEELQKAQRSMETTLMRLYVEAASMLERTARETNQLREVEKLIANYNRIPKS